MKLVYEAKWVKNNEDLPPLSPKTLKEMRFIIDGIMDGTLAHEQRAWHSLVFKGKEEDGNICGTAHCVAGWCELIGKKADKQKKSFFNVKFLIPVKKIGYYFGVGRRGDINCDPISLKNGFDDFRDASSYTQERWDLSRLEADNLFYATNKKRTINAIIKKFEAGYRMDYLD